MKTRYEVFIKKEFLSPVHRGMGFLEGFDTKDKAIQYIRDAHALNVERGYIPKSMIICEVRYSPIFEIENNVSIQTTEKVL